MAGNKRLLIVLPTPDYKALAEIARREDRTPDEQASHLLKQLVISQEQATR